MTKPNMLEVLKEHTKREDERFNQLIEDISTIKNNHLHHMEKDIAGIHIKMAILGSDLNVKMASFSTDLSWVKWGIILVLGALVTGSIALIFKG